MFACSATDPTRVSMPRSTICAVFETGFWRKSEALRQIKACRPLICGCRHDNGKLVEIACIAMPVGVHLRPALPISGLGAPTPREALRYRLTCVMIGLHQAAGVSDACKARLRHGPGFLSLV